LPNDAPVASNVQITGVLQVGATLTGTYSYTDNEGDLEGTSTYQWMRVAADDSSTPIQGATSLDYTLVEADEGARIRLEVTPVAQTGTLTGALASSEPTDLVIGVMTITDITPPSMPKGGGGTVTIRGANFLEGATISFDPGQGPAPTVESPVSVSADGQTITATLSIKTGGPKGTLVWVLRVTNPGGSTAMVPFLVTDTP
jgi:hypothetical protein